MNLQFVKLYREVIYFLSLTIGLYIKNYLERQSYDVKLIKNYDTSIDDQYGNCDHIELLGKIVLKSRHFSYTEVFNNDDSIKINDIYSQSKTLMNLYDAITNENRNNILHEYNYNFVEMKELSYLYKKIT